MLNDLSDLDRLSIVELVEEGGTLLISFERKSRLAEWLEILFEMLFNTWGLPSSESPGCTSAPLALMTISSTLESTLIVRLCESKKELNALGGGSTIRRVPDSALTGNVDLVGDSLISST